MDQASAGERIIIERDHHRIAAIVPIEDAHQLDGHSEEARHRKRAAMARIRERALEMRQGTEPVGETWDAGSAVRWERDRGHGDG